MEELMEFMRGLDWSPFADLIKDWKWWQPFFLFLVGFFCSNDR